MTMTKDELLDAVSAALAPGGVLYDDVEALMLSGMPGKKAGERVLRDILARMSSDCQPDARSKPWLISLSIIDWQGRNTAGEGALLAASEGRDDFVAMSNPKFRYGDWEQCIGFPAVARLIYSAIEMAGLPSDTFGDIAQALFNLRPQLSKNERAERWPTTMRRTSAGARPQYLLTVDIRRPDQEI